MRYAELLETSRLSQEELLAIARREGSADGVHRHRVHLFLVRVGPLFQEDVHDFTPEPGDRKKS